MLCRHLWNIAYVHNERIYRSILSLIDIRNQIAITAFVMKHEAMHC